MLNVENANETIYLEDGSVQLLTVVPAGKRAMSASDWLNGFKPQPGERFE